MSREKITAHYTVDDLTNRVVGAIKLQRGGLDNLTVEDLAPVDGFHIRGRKATAELAGLLKMGPADRILDVGSGPGGTARFLADRHGCHVIGLDLTLSYAVLANQLSRLVGLGRKTDFICGNAVEIPFDDGSFDIVWSEHVQMNIRAKEKYITELSRVLKPSGKIAFYEVFKGPNGAPYLPAPWSSDSSTSFIIDAGQMKSLVMAANLDIQHWDDVTDVCHVWFQNMRNRIRAKGASPLGIHLLLGAGAKDKIANMGRSLADGRARVVRAVLDKPGHSRL